MEETSARRQYLMEFTYERYQRPLDRRRSPRYDPLDEPCRGVMREPEPLGDPIGRETESNAHRPRASGHPVTT